VSEEVTLLKIIAQKDQRIRDLEAAQQQMSPEIKLLKEKIDILIRRLFGSKSDKLDAAQLELLLKEDALGKADASAEKAELASGLGIGCESSRRSRGRSRRRNRDRCHVKNE
jgi:hypothetical protein